MPLRYGGRCRPNNLREGAMVPLLRTFLREIKPRLAPTEILAAFFFVILFPAALQVLKLHLILGTLERAGCHDQFRGNWA